jgi:hypothetical protein
MNKVLLAAAMVAALILAACGASTPSASPAPSAAPSVAVVSPSPTIQPSPSSSPSAEPTGTPVPTPAPSAKPTPKPTPVAFSRAEKYLVEGIMRGVSDCSPVRGDALPGAAFAGIDCDLVDSPAARMGFYLFKSDDDMLDVYMARVSVENLVVDSGACVPGEGEGAYIPYGEDEFSPDRHACYVNDQGYGNYRATLPGVHVYMGLLGRTKDMRSLEDWAWLGNEDTPGAPTLWQQDHVYK